MQNNRPFTIFMLVLAAFIGGFSLIKSQKSSVTKDTIEMVVATFHPRTGTAEVEGLYQFKKIVEERSNKRIRVDVFYGGTLGGERELVEQLKLGTIHMCLGGWATRSTYINDLIPWGVPYLFDDKEEIQKTIGGRIGKSVKQAFAQNDIEWIGIYFRGSRHLTANRRVFRPEDLKGVSIRLPENPDWIPVWKAFGCLPSPIPSPEIFGSLQTGVVEAQENPISSNYSRKLWEVQKFTILTSHIIDINSYLISAPFMASIDVHSQQLIRRAAADTLEWCTDYVMRQSEEMKHKMEQHGMIFIEPDLKPFQEIALDNLDHFKNKWKPWVYEETIQVLLENRQ